MVNNKSQGVKGDKHYGVLIGNINSVIFENDSLREVYFYCGCLSGSVDSMLLIVDLYNGIVVDQLKLSKNKEVC